VAAKNNGGSSCGMMQSEVERRADSGAERRARLSSMLAEAVTPA
jgi:hypothetical protein